MLFFGFVEKYCVVGTWKNCLHVSVLTISQQNKKKKINKKQMLKNIFGTGVRTDPHAKHFLSTLQTWDFELWVKYIVSFWNKINRTRWESLWGLRKMNTLTREVILSEIFLPLLSVVLSSQEERINSFLGRILCAGKQIEGYKIYLPSEKEMAQSYKLYPFPRNWT